MFQITIGGLTAMFSKFFSPADREVVLAAISEAKASRVVFIDTPATGELVATIASLASDGVEVVVRDHHDVEDAEVAKGGRSAEVRQAADKIRALVPGAVISTRRRNPACSSLIAAGEFVAPGTVLVADSDLDGLTAAMKAAGVVYARLDQDADVLDGGRAGQTADKLSAEAFLLTRAMSSLPPFDAARPQVSEDAKAKLFSNFVAVVQGDAEARTQLEKGVEQYEAGVKEAERLAALVTDILPGVAHIDVTSSPRFDMGTLAVKMEGRPGCKVTVQRKLVGPIASAEVKAGRSGVQYSLAVAKASQAEVNLQGLLVPGFTSSPEAGVISNTTFLLHVSEKVWEEVVLPALKARFGGR